MSCSKSLGLFVALLAGAVVSAQGEDFGAIQKKLAADFAVTQATAEYDDIVTAGAVLVLEKSNLILGPSTSSLYQNIYKDGRIEASSFAKTKSFFHKMSGVPGLGAIPGVGTAAGTAASADSNTGASPRTYVTGEKMWVTKIEVKTENKEPEVVFELFTDAVNNVRYRGALRFPFPKGSSDDQVEKLVSEVFKVQPQDAQQDQSSSGGQSAPAPAPAPAAGGQTPVPPVATPPAPTENTPLPAIAPPPPPADAPATPPPTVSLGQTPDQVAAALGQPQKIVKLGKKETYYYKDLKVIFTDGKVTDVQ